METLNGRSAYRYDTALDKEKLALYLKKVAADRGEPMPQEELDSLLTSFSATGELWVDAENFFIHKLTWDVQKLPVGASPPLAVKFTVTLRDHNAAPPVTPPEKFELFSPFMFLQSTTGTEMLPSGFEALTENELDAIITGDEEAEPLNFQDLPF